MSLIEDKLSRFEQLIASEIDEKIRAIDEDIEAHKAEELSKAQESQNEQNTAFIQSKMRKIQAQYRQQVTIASLNTKRELLKCRDEITSKVFSSVEQRLRDFTEGPDYKAYFMKSLQSAFAGFPADGACVLVREKDLSMGKDIRDAFGCDVAADNKILLGGFILKNEAEGVLIDQTLETLLNDQHAYFNRNSGLSVAIDAACTE